MRVRVRVRVHVHVLQGTVQQLANGDLLRPLQVECWDYDRAGGHDYIGGCSASIADMQVCWCVGVRVCAEEGGGVGGSRTTALRSTSHMYGMGVYLRKLVHLLA